MMSVEVGIVWLLYDDLLCQMASANLCYMLLILFLKLFLHMQSWTYWDLEMDELYQCMLWSDAYFTETMKMLCLV